MKSLTLKDKFHLEKVILNPIDRSLGRYQAVLEYVKKNAKIEYWKSPRNRKKDKVLSLHFPDQNGIIKNYHSCLDFQEGKDDQEKEQKVREKLAQQIFTDY